MSFDPPIFITVRDRVSDLRRLVAFLENAGHQRIVLVDNASTFGPLLEYLEASPHVVIRLGKNLGSRSAWRQNLVPDEAFIVSDPDVVPIEECPFDAAERLRELLERYPRYPKAGLGLYLEDVPATMRSLEWERSLISPERMLEPGVYGSLVDTTFALYRPRVQFSLEGIRTGWPYQARHTPWYGNVTDEDRYYLEHAVGGVEGSSWKDGRQV